MNNTKYLKMVKNELTYKTERDSQTQNRLVVAKEERRDELGVWD